MKIKFNSIRIFCLVATLALSMSATQWLSAACTIEFDHPSGTLITTQYLSCGVVFEGDVGNPPPWVYDYGDYPGRIMTSHDWYAPIIVSFVEPGNINQYRPVSYIEFDIPTEDQDHVTVDVYNASGSLIASYSSPTGGGSPETISFSFGSPSAAYMVIDDFDNTAFAVDTMTVHRFPDPIFRDRFFSYVHWRWSDVFGVQDPK